VRFWLVSSHAAKALWPAASGRICVSAPPSPDPATQEPFHFSKRSRAVPPVSAAVAVEASRREDRGVLVRRAREPPDLPLVDRAAAGGGDGLLRVRRPARAASPRGPAPAHGDRRDRRDDWSRRRLHGTCGARARPEGDGRRRAARHRQRSAQPEHGTCGIVARGAPSRAGGVRVRRECRQTASGTSIAR